MLRRRRERGRAGWIRLVGGGARRGKRRLVAESYQSGDSVTAVAQRHSVHASVLFRWRRRYRKAADSGAGFVPVVVEAPEVASEAPSGRMEIVLGGDVRVVVDATVHAPALARVLAVVAVVAGRSSRFLSEFGCGWQRG